jgi:predicted 3-demethylubiquinone-9 3-methyltransferase (glyoxalase superfamily)
MPTITPFLWFDGKAEEAANFYVSVFGERSRITRIVRCGETGPGPVGSVLTVTFEIDGREFVGLNGGPQFRFTEAVSFAIECRTQQEIDAYWEKLSAGGEVQQCGWLKDRYGLSWQIVPASLLGMLADPDVTRRDRVMTALLRMTKLDADALRAAFEAH